jgi:hypothetical protein
MEQAANWKYPQREARGGLKCFPPGVYEHPMSTGRRIYISDERSFRSGEPKTVFEPHDSVIAGEGNDQAAVEGSSDGNPFIHQVDMESQIENWRRKAKEISASAEVLRWMS